MYMTAKVQMIGKIASWNYLRCAGLNAVHVYLGDKDHSRSNYATLDRNSVSHIPMFVAKLTDSFKTKDNARAYQVKSNL